MRRLNPIDFAVLIAIAAAFLFFFRSVPSREPFYYDESDYMNAGERGLENNFLERPTNSFFGFLDIGLHHEKLDQRSSLSDLARGSHDIDFYRHFHGPLYYYWIALISPLVHGNEYAMRFSGYTFHVLTFFAIAIGLFTLTSNRSAALAASFLYLFGQASIATAATIASHAPYVLFTALTLLLFAHYLQTGSRQSWYWAVAAFTGAFCSIDYAILLPITFAICLFVSRRERRLPGSVLLRSLLVFLGLLLLLWPFGVLRLTALKGYFYIAYLAMQRKGSYGDYGPFTVWWQRFLASPVEYSIDVLALIGVFALWRTPAIRKYRAVLLPCLLYAFFMLLTTLKNTSLNPTYVSSILPPLAIVSGTALAALTARVSAPVRILSTASILAATVLGGYGLVMRHVGDGPGPSPDALLISTIRQSGLSDSSLIVPYELLPTLSYYFPQLKVHSYLVTDNANVVEQKLRDYDASGIVYRPRPSDKLPELLKRLGRMREQNVGDKVHTVIYHFDGRS